MRTELFKKWCTNNRAKFPLCKFPQPLYGHKLVRVYKNEKRQRCNICNRKSAFICKGCNTFKPVVLCDDTATGRNCFYQYDDHKHLKPPVEN